MRLSPRFLTSFLAGGMLLALPGPYPAVHAETPPPPAEAPAARPEPTPTDAPREAPAAQAPVAPVPGPAEVKPGLEPQPKSDAQAPAPSPARFKSELPLPREEETVSTEEELRFVAKVNEERAQRGLSQLRIDPLLIRVARLHSAEMRDKAYFSHESPTEGIRTPLDRYLQLCSNRPSYACVGENLFWATVTDVERGHQAFMKSPTHRENVLFPRYEKIGVGIVKRGAEFWVTQMYLSTTDPVSVAKNRMMQ